MRRFGSGGSPRFRFMEGRYGADELGRFLSISGCAAMLLGLVLGRAAPFLSRVLIFLALGLVIWCYSRVMSRNMARRREENEKYLRKRIGVQDWIALKRTCFDQRREYAFFRCRGCARTVRVPKGKGRMRITCRHCGYTFEKKT